jgi:[CysO sulfur-carrier protein]-S-L-cysteine hydrolase
VEDSLNRYLSIYLVPVVISGKINYSDDAMLILEKKYLDEMTGHARSEAPNECCGILAGKNGRAVKLYPTINSEHSPTRYSVDLNDLVRVYQETSENGWDLLAIYHSHIRHPAYPSPVDIRYAYFPQSFYIIISLDGLAQPDVRLFTIRKGEVTEDQLKVIDDPPSNLL